MMNFLIALAITTSVISLILGYVYIMLAVDYRDVWFVLRKRQFKKKLLKKGFKTTWALLDTLLSTSEKDWELQGSRMIYKPFVATKIQFVDDMWIDLQIFEGTGARMVFEMSYFDDTKQLSYGYDPITHQDLNEEDTFRMEQVMFHLQTIKTNLEIEKNHEQAKQEKLKKQVFYEAKMLKTQQILSMMKKYIELEGIKEEDNVVFHLKKEEAYTSFTISMDSKVYFQALELKDSGEIKTTLHNETEEESTIFSEIRDALEAYANFVLKAQHHKEKQRFANENLFEEDHADDLRKIRERITYLEKEEKWLSDASLHQIRETFPKDIEALHEVYRTVTKRENVRSDVEQSLQAICEKLAQFAAEVETNKYKEIQKRKMIIKER